MKASLPLLLCILLLTACGEKEDIQTRTDPAAQTPTLPVTPSTVPDKTPQAEDPGDGYERIIAKLTFSPLTADKGEKSFSISCDSRLRRSTDSVCVRLGAFANRDLITPAGGSQICTKIYGGSQQVNVEGTINGKDYSGIISREDGCAIDRWERWTDVVGRPLLKHFGV